VRLAAATGNILNVPLNLAIDLLNVPDSEIQAIDMLARAQMFSGPWFVVGPTNIWGVDPGDPGRFRSLVSIAVPFLALNGLNLDPNDQNGLGQQVWMLVAAELPVTAACDVNGCMPTVPTSPITGIRGIDSFLWSLAILTGMVKFPLLDNVFKVPLSELINGYTFGPGTPDYANPDGPVFPGLGFPGTTVGPNGENLMPWANTTFKLDLFKPFANYFDHLMADPSTNPIRLPDLVGLGRTLQTFAAGMVIAFDPITPGSGWCPNACANLPAQFDYPAVVKFIGDLWPGNENIDGWLTAYANGTANVPTQAQIAKNIELIQNGQQFWSFGNTPLPDSSSNTGFNLSSLAPFFHQLFTNLGLNPPPLAPPAPPAPPLTGPVQQAVNALTGGPETQLKAKVIEKDPQSAIASALGLNPPPLNSTSVEPEETSSVDALIPQTGLNQGLPPLTGSGTQTPGSAPPNDTVRKPGFVPRLVNQFLPHPSGTNTTTTGTKTTGSDTDGPGAGANGPGAGANGPGADTKPTDPDTKPTDPDTKKSDPDSHTSTGAHSGGGSAG
jgi:hypothetical protein